MRRDGGAHRVLTRLTRQQGTQLDKQAQLILCTRQQGGFGSVAERDPALVMVKVGGQLSAAFVRKAGGRQALSRHPSRAGSHARAHHEGADFHACVIGLAIMQPQQFSTSVVSKAVFAACHVVFKAGGARHDKCFGGCGGCVLSSRLGCCRNWCGCRGGNHDGWLRCFRQCVGRYCFRSCLRIFHRVYGAIEL